MENNIFTLESVFKISACILFIHFSDFPLLFSLQRYAGALIQTSKALDCR